MGNRRLEVSFTQVRCLLDVLTKLQKATISFIMFGRFSAHSSVRSPESGLESESGLSQTAHSPSKHKDKHGFVILQCKHTEL